MRPVETRIVVKRKRRCGECQEHYSSDPPKFCVKCGNSLEYRTEVKLCPFCGEEWQERQWSDHCDEESEFFLGRIGDDCWNQEDVYRKDDDLYLVHWVKSYDTWERTSIEAVDVQKVDELISKRLAELKKEMYELEEMSDAL
jgi:hypothetical protein